MNNLFEFMRLLNIAFPIDRTLGRGTFEGVHQLTFDQEKQELDLRLWTFDPHWRSWRMNHYPLTDLNLPPQETVNNILEYYRILGYGKIP